MGSETTTEDRSTEPSDPAKGAGGVGGAAPDLAGPRVPDGSLLPGPSDGDDARLAEGDRVQDLLILAAQRGGRDPVPVPSIGGEPHACATVVEPDGHEAVVPDLDDPVHPLVPGTAEVGIGDELRGGLRSGEDPDRPVLAVGRAAGPPPRSDEPDLRPVDPVDQLVHPARRRNGNAIPARRIARDPQGRVGVAAGGVVPPRHQTSELRPEREAVHLLVAARSQVPHRHGLPHVPVRRGPDRGVLALGVMPGTDGDERRRRSLERVDDVGHLLVVRPAEARGVRELPDEHALRRWVRSCRRARPRLGLRLRARARIPEEERQEEPGRCGGEEDPHRDRRRAQASSPVSLRPGPGGFAGLLVGPRGSVLGEHRVEATEELGAIGPPARVDHLEGVPPRQRADVPRELVPGGHPRPADEHRDDADARAPQARGDLRPHVVARLVQPPAPLRAEPLRADDHQHDLRLAERAVDRRDEVRTGLDGVHVAEDLVRAEVAGDVLLEAVGVDERVLAPVADEDAVHRRLLASAVMLT